MRALQQKFQISADYVDNDDVPTNWASVPLKSTGRFGENWTPSRSDSVDGRKFNVMPPGEQINQNPSMPFSIGGATDVSRDANSGAYASGFTPQSFSDSDQETGTNTDLFNDDAGGFMPRHNYLDRE